MYDHFFRSHPDPSWMYEPGSLRFLDVNHAAVSAYGYTRDEFLCMTIADISPAEDVAGLQGYLSRAPTGPQLSGVWRHRRQNGEIIHVDIRSGDYTLDGRAVRLVTARDVTERLRLEEQNAALLELDVTHTHAQQRQLQLLETAVSRLNDIVMITEAEPLSELGPRIVFVNDAFERRTGYKREEVIGRTPRFLQGPLTDRAELGRIAAALRDWKPVRADLVNYTKSGEPFWLELDIVPVADANGWFTHWVSVERDVTERRRYEALNEQVSRLSGIGGWEFDVLTKETIWSPQVRKIYAVDETYNPSPEDYPKFVAPESSEAMALARRRAVVDGAYTEIEFQALTATGRRIWVRNIYQAERVNGRTTRIFGTAQDVTAERAAQAEMEALHARLTVAIEAAELRVWEIDLETGVMQGLPHLSPIFAQPGMTGTIGTTSALEFLHPEDRVEFEQHASLVVLHDQTSVSRVRVRAGDGSVRHIEIRMRRSSSCADRRKILGVSRDVTRDVTLTDDLVRKQREAEEASLAKGQFVARMSHEIRTPMSGVIGMLEVLLRAEVDQNKRAHATTALKSARDLMSVLDDIIDVSQLESRHLSLDNAPFSLLTVVDDVVSLFDTLARAKSLALTADVAARVPGWVVGDRRRVRQVLTNLVGNAIKFTDAGKIEVSVSYDADQQVARFAVRDTGAGIAKDVSDKVFDQFFQADSSTTRTHGGSGLGLAISRQLVGMMGG